MGVGVTVTLKPSHDAVAIIIPEASTVSNLLKILSILSSTATYLCNVGGIKGFNLAKSEYNWSPGAQGIDAKHICCAVALSLQTSCLI